MATSQCALRGAPLLRKVTEAMHQIAPLALADTSWDNVGILVDATDDEAIVETHEEETHLTSPQAPHVPARPNVLLTIDLTHHVVTEAIRNDVGCIVAYHPPLFQKLRQLHAGHGKHGPVLRCLRQGISVYTPHTAMDACVNGCRCAWEGGCGWVRGASWDETSERWRH